MRCLYDRKESRRFDREAEARYKMPTLLLMENAGRRAAEILVEEFQRTPGALERIVIVGGGGQNGGDAWVVARQLLSMGYGPIAFSAVDPEHIVGDARVNYEILARLGREPRAIASVAALLPALEEATLLVDGLFGTGLSRPIEGKARAIIHAMNSAKAPIVALDLPSGVDCDTGEVQGIAVQAALTVSFLGEKRGLRQYPGRAHAGKIAVASLGLPRTAETQARLLEASDVSRWWKGRPPDSHKGIAGHIAAYAGSAEKPGAALLAGMGALRTGAGLVSLIPPPSAEAALAPRVLELMFERRSLGDLGESFKRKDAGLIGPGLGDSAEAEAWMERILSDFPAPLVIDADALNFIARHGALGALKDAKGARILTPHPREAARLLGVETREIQRDRYHSAVELARRSGQTVVLKGAATVIADAEGALRVSPESHPALGTGGTGDVLSGMIAALLVDHPPLVAASLAVLIHAHAARESACLDRGLLASELAAAIPRALKKLIAGQSALASS